MIGNDKFVQVFGSVPAGDDTLLTQIVSNAVREGFHIVLCAPGTDRPVCTLPANKQKYTHPCGPFHVLSLESLLERTWTDPWYLTEIRGSYSPKDKAKVRAKVTALINRVTKQYDGVKPNIAVIPGPSGYAPWHREAQDRSELVGPTVIGLTTSDLWWWYTIPKMADSTGVSVLVPPSKINGIPFRIIGQTCPAPQWLLDTIGAP